MKIETDLEIIKKLAAERDDENWDFRAFIRSMDIEPEDLDSIAHKITEDVTKQIDCTTCGNCCKQIPPHLNQKDSKRFAEGLKMPLSEFKNSYLTFAPGDDSILIFNTQPCPFLTDNKCSNYEHRPQDCQEYPHLHKEGFRSRLMGVLSNYEICPIVFNVYERLKIELWQ